MANTLPTQPEEIYVHGYTKGVKDIVDFLHRHDITVLNEQERLLVILFGSDVVSNNPYRERSLVEQREHYRTSEE